MNFRFKRAAAGAIALAAFGVLSACNEDMGTLGGNASQAMDINTAGIAVGNATDVGGNSHVFVWDRDHKPMSDISTPGTAFTVAGITDANDVAAQAAGPFVHHSGSPTWDTLPRPAGFLSSTVIKAAGDGVLVGYGLNASSQLELIAWNAPSATVLHTTLPNATLISVAGLNDHGVAVGSITPTSDPGARIPFTWDAHTGTFTALAPPAVTKASGMAIDNNGRVLIQQVVKLTLTNWLYTPGSGFTNVLPTLNAFPYTPPPYYVLSDQGHVYVGNRVFDLATGVEAVDPLEGLGHLTKLPQAFAVNSSEDVVGWSWYSKDVNHKTEGQRAVIWYHD
jgi:hypothetical protein